MKLLGIDIGGSGIKGGMVDIEKGEMIGERHRLETPLGADPMMSRQLSPRLFAISTGVDRSAAPFLPSFITV